MARNHPISRTSSFVCCGLALDPEVGHAKAAARLGWTLHSFWWYRGLHTEGRRWMEAALGRVLSPASRARALVVAGVYDLAYYHERLGLSSGQNNRDDRPEARLEWVLGSSGLRSASIVLPCSNQELPGVASARDDQHADGRANDVQPDPRYPKQERDGA